MQIVTDAMSRVRQNADHEPPTEQALLDMAACHRRLAGLRHWKWQLSRNKEDLDRAIISYGPALSYTERAREEGVFLHPGFLAQTRLKLMLLFRFRHDNPERPDPEGHREAILSIKPLQSDDRLGISHLTWYQAITLADAGSGHSSQQKATAALAADALLRTEVRYWEVGRRQYRTMRRFLEQNSHVFRNRSRIGTMAQFLLIGEQR